MKINLISRYAIALGALETISNPPEGVSRGELSSFASGVLKKIANGVKSGY